MRVLGVEVWWVCVYMFSSSLTGARRVETDVGVGREEGDVDADLTQGSGRGRGALGMGPGDWGGGDWPLRTSAPGAVVGTRVGRFSIPRFEKRISSGSFT